MALGVANSALLDGRLLVGVDVIYKLWNEADLYQAIYDNQIAVQTGTQLSLNRYRVRAGYVWAENPIDQTPGSNLGGMVQPGDLAIVVLDCQRIVGAAVANAYIGLINFFNTNHDANCNLGC